jgi:hypothetical protein
MEPRLMNTSKIVTECFIEMFRRVGISVGSFDEIFAWAKEKGDEWYYKREWTAEEESDFKDWMFGFLKKKTRWSNHTIDKEIAMFMLNYGWKTKE